MYPTPEEEIKNLSASDTLLFQEIEGMVRIDGWLMVKEAIALYDLATRTTSQYPVFCEIGSWKGKSAYVFGTAIKTLGCGVHYCVDPFSGIGDAASEPVYKKDLRDMDIPLLSQFVNNLNREGVLHTIRILPAISENARLLFRESRIDVLFIDGNHEYQYVQRDIALWAPLIPSGGWLAIHDYGATHVDGPRRAVDERLRTSPDWMNGHVIGEMYVTQRV